MHTFTHVYVCIHANMHTYHIHTLHIHIHSLTQTHKYIHTHMRTHTHIQIHIHAHTNTHTHTDTYVYTWTHTYIHTYIHLYTCIHLQTYVRTTQTRVPSNGKSMGSFDLNSPATVFSLPKLGSKAVAAAAWVSWRPQLVFALELCEGLLLGTRHFHIHTLWFYAQPTLWDTATKIMVSQGQTVTP
jgi:hypothetical protein